jgi:signal transduction histidine kinase
MLFLLSLTVLTVAFAALLLRPPDKDLLLLALFLPISGATSLGLGLLFLASYRGSLLRGMRGRMLAALVLAAGIVFINVGFTGYLMFLSSHDLELMTLLMLFSLGLATYFAFVVTDAFNSALADLLSGVRTMGEGALDTRVEIHSGDELEDLANAFNIMASRLEESAASQRDLEAARRQLIAAVSHDLRTPLATMRVMIESINDGVVTDVDTIQRYHGTMQAEISYLTRLIDDLFELSQIDSGLLELRPERSNIADLVSDTLEALRPQAEQRLLSLYGEVDGPLPTVLLDVPRMQRVLYNLVQNSLRHTPPQGSIWIRAIDSGPDVAISVEDTGEGVDSAELPHIFERFYRGNKARTRDTAGSGLGLTIAKGIVELHGGRIWAESTLHHGASFIFTVPKAGQRGDGLSKVAS